MLTGLRKTELASLTIGQLHLDGLYPFVELYGRDEKNRQGSQIALRGDLAADLDGLWSSSRCNAIAPTQGALRGKLV